MERARSLYHKARQLQYKSLTGEAIHSLELSVQLDPASDEAYPVWLLLGQLRMSNPAWATRSVNAFQAAARIRPANAEPWICMGQVYHRKGFRTNALACFQKAIELDPSVPMPHGIDLAELENEPANPLPAPTLFEKFKSILKGQDRG
jgi:cytochrome c-type biogenesis protein CcmH/NrfG